MNTAITFRRAIQSDKSFLLALRKQSMGEHLIAAGLVYSDEQHLARIEECFEDSSIILQGEEPIGLIKLGAFLERIHIRQFQILPRHQGLGLGKRILQLIQSKAIERGVPVTLNVLLKNPAKRLYERAGFQVVGQNELEYQMLWRANAMS